MLDDPGSVGFGYDAGLARLYKDVGAELLTVVGVRAAHPLAPV